MIPKEAKMLMLSLYHVGGCFSSMAMLEKPHEKIFIFYHSGGGRYVFLPKCDGG